MNTISCHCANESVELNKLEVGTYFKLNEDDNFYIKTEDKTNTGLFICVNVENGRTAYCDPTRLVNHIYNAHISLTEKFV